jgi:hypothetical protein
VQREDVDEVVREPATDRPALTDQTTAALFSLLERRIKSARSGFAVAPLMVLSIGSMFLGGIIWTAPFLILYGIPIALFLFVLGQATVAQVRFGRWLPRGRRLLTTQPWRSVPAKLVGPRVLEVRSGDQDWHLRVRLYDAVRRVIARTGRVWLVGPDDRGWFALRIDGAHAPWPARRTRSRGGREVTWSAPSTTPTAAHDPVSASWAATVARLARLGLLPYVALAAIFVLLSIGLAWGTHLVIVWVVFGLICVTPCLVLLAIRVRRTRDLRRLIPLLSVGPWQRVRAELHSWKFQEKGYTNVTGTVFLDNGVRLSLFLPSANADLLGNIWETGTAWFAGEPTPGKTMAVGFPGYPVLGVARLS